MAGQSLHPDTLVVARFDRLLTDSDEFGKNFVLIMIHYIWISFAILALGVFGGRCLDKIMRTACKEQMHGPSSPRSVTGTQGLFAHSDWPIYIRGPVGLFFFLVGIVPLSMMLVSLLFGTILAGIEGWSPILGIEYVVSNVLGLQVPLTNVTPVQPVGLVLDVVMSIQAMLVVTTAMGCAAGMSLTRYATDTVPKSTWALLRYLFIYIPTVLIGTSLATGGIMAFVEDMAFLDGFLFMAGSMAGLANPLTNEAPDSPFGCFFEVLCISVEICLGGAVIGIVGAHPRTQRFIVCMEGASVDWYVEVKQAAARLQEIDRLRTENARLKAELLEGQTRQVDCTQDINPDEGARTNEEDSFCV